MSFNIPAVTVTMVKQASGNVQIVFTSGNNPAPGGQLYACVIPSADFTSFNTTVNGGAAGATLAKTYAADLNQGDYPYGTVIKT